MLRMSCVFVQSLEGTYIVLDLLKSEFAFKTQLPRI